MLAEVRPGMPSHVTTDLMADLTADLTADLMATPRPLSDDEIRERMSGNLCRCSAYPGIVAAIRDVAGAAS